MDAKQSKRGPIYHPRDGFCMRAHERCGNLRLVQINLNGTGSWQSEQQIAWLSSRQLSGRKCGYRTCLLLSAKSDGPLQLSGADVLFTLSDAMHSQACFRQFSSAEGIKKECSLETVHAIWRIYA